MSAAPEGFLHLHVAVHFLFLLLEGDPVAWVLLLVTVVAVVFAVRRDLRANRKVARSAAAKPEPEGKAPP
jgi:hypothetical protein